MATPMPKKRSVDSAPVAPPTPVFEPAQPPPSDGAALSITMGADPDAKEEHWINSHWRPMMGWSYALICFFDFLVAPILWSVFQAAVHGSVTQQWAPVTLQGGGLYHLALGAIMGITSFGRTKEKLAGVSGNT